MEKNNIHILKRLTVVVMALALVLTTVLIPTTVKAATTDAFVVKQYTLAKGEKWTLNVYDAADNAKISYKSSKSSVASVNKNGVVTAKKKGTAVITLLTQEALKDKMISNVREVSTRGGNIFAIANQGDEIAKTVAEEVVYIPKTVDLLTPLVSVVPLQLLSYYVAKNKGCDVDKPRNLAKSVTVE